MKTYEFNSSDAPYESGIAGEYETVIIVQENGWIRSDLMTECKSWKTAVRRFFKALRERYPDIAEEWEESVKESVKSGYPKDNDSRLADGNYNMYYSYAWEIENLSENVWYIFLNVNENRYE